MGLTRLRETVFAGFSPVKEQSEGNGLVPQPKEYNDRRESALRNLITRIADYAESGPTFDPSGKYLCGTCLLRADNAPRTSCASVSGTINNLQGGCRQYIRGDAAGSRLRFGGQISQRSASYGERPKSKGFGCSRCTYAQKARKADAKGRSLWCGYWGLHVLPAACCEAEEGSDLVEAPGEKKAAAS